MADEKALRSLDDQARIAALKRDVPALERLWSDQFVVNAPNNQVIIGKRAVLDDFVRSGIINFSSFERQIEFIRIDGDVATTMGLETVVPISDSPQTGSKLASRYSVVSRTSGSVTAARGACSSGTPTSSGPGDVMLVD